MSPENKGRILVADDSRFFLQSLQRLLASDGYTVYTAEDGAAAVEVAKIQRPDLILLDIEMPRLDGIDACRKIKENPDTLLTPILFVTSNAASEIRLRGLRAGGEEFLTKPFVPEEILAQVDKFMRRVKSHSGLLDKVKILEDERNNLQKRIAASTTDDALAQAFRITPTNSLILISDVGDSLISFVRENQQFVVLYVAVDNMDRVDMLFGSEIVFETHTFIFNKIVEYLRELHPDLNSIRISRNLADDFVVFLPDALLTHLRLDSGNIDDFGVELLKHVRHALETQFPKREVAPVINLTTGVSWVSTTSRLSFNRQILNALRDSSNSAYNFQSRGRIRLHNRLREMIQTRAMRIVCQPIVRTADCKIFAYEALSRGLFPELERPQLMFDVAEESKQVVALSRLCREKAFEILHKITPPRVMFVNFHPEDFHDNRLRAGAADDPLFKIDPKRVVIEVTERSAIRDAQNFKETIEGLKHLGFKIAIDDLGSGYTSLSLIASLEPDYIKFDMSLVRGVHLSPTKQALLKTLSQFTQDIGATSVAEGVETVEEFDIVREFKCDLCQGFYFSRPTDEPIEESEFEFSKT